jgi:hypothetical protein
VTQARQRTLAVELLATPDYRRYWLSSTSFSLGIWAFIVSMGYSAKQLTDSPFRVSLVSVAYFLPMFLLALPSGVLADAVDRKKTVVACRGGSAVVAVVLTALSAFGQLSYPLLVVLCGFVGASVVLEVAARQAYVTQVVRPDQVAGATGRGGARGRPARCRRADRLGRAGGRLPVLRGGQRLLRLGVHRHPRGLAPAAVAGPSRARAAGGDGLPPSYP